MTRMVVWKFAVEIRGYVERELPAGAQIIAVDVQHGKPCMWALVDPEARGEIRRFYLLRTGHEIDGHDRDRLRHLGTFLLDGGAFVGHLFEVERRDV